MNLSESRPEGWFGRCLDKNVDLFPSILITSRYVSNLNFRLCLCLGNFHPFPLDSELLSQDIIATLKDLSLLLGGPQLCLLLRKMLLTVLTEPDTHTLTHTQALFQVSHHQIVGFGCVYQENNDHLHLQMKTLACCLKTTLARVTSSVCVHVCLLLWINDCSPGQLPHRWPCVGWLY